MTTCQMSLRSSAFGVVPPEVRPCIVEEPRVEGSGRRHNGAAANGLRPRWTARSFGGRRPAATAEMSARLGEGPWRNSGARHSAGNGALATSAEQRSRRSPRGRTPPSPPGIGATASITRAVQIGPKPPHSSMSCTPWATSARATSTPSSARVTPTAIMVNAGDVISTRCRRGSSCAPVTMNPSFVSAMPPNLAAAIGGPSGALVRAARLLG
jgi:hypothetical protein